MVDSPRPRLLFAPATWGQAETLRLLAIAAAARERFDVAFADYGGPHASWIDDAGWPRHPLEPRLDEARVRRLLEVDQRRGKGELFTTDELRDRVASERSLLEAWRPAAVVSGFCLSFAISARVAGIPLVTVRPVTGTRYYYRAGLGRWTDAASRRPWTAIPERWRDGLRNRLAVVDPRFTAPFNEVALGMGLPRFRSMWDLFEGDCCLICDPPEAAELGSLPQTVRFVGAIELGVSVQGLGTASIGGPELGLGDEPTSRLSGRVAVLDGDHKRLQAAGFAGLPVVGVGANPEQEANLDVLVRQGVALRVRRRRCDERRLRDPLTLVVKDPGYRRRAERWQRVLRSRDGAQEASRAIEAAITNGFPG